MQGAFAARVVVRFDGAVLEDRYVAYTDAPLRVLLPSEDELRFVDVHPGALGDTPLALAEGAFSLHAQIASPPRPFREGGRAWADKAALAIVASLVSLAFVAPFAIVFGTFAFDTSRFGWPSAASLRLPDDVILRARENALAQEKVSQLYPSVHYAASGPRPGATQHARSSTKGPKRGPRHGRVEALHTDETIGAIPRVNDYLLAAFVEPTPGRDMLGSVGGGDGDGGGGDAASTPVANKDHDDLDTISLGTIGTIARDSGVGSDDELGEPYDVAEFGAGGGDGDGYGSRDHCLFASPCHVPDLLPGTAAVRGMRDKESIRRVIRAHLNEVRFCYESNAQSADADLSGRLVVEFVIASSGEVVAVQYGPSGLANAGAAGARTANCVTRAFGRWRFGNVPNIGVTRVSYPFQFELAMY